MIELNAAQGRWDSGNAAERERRKAEIVATLSAIGIPDTELSQIAQSDKGWNTVDYVDGILTLAEKEISVEKRAEWQQEKAKITLSIDNIKETGPNTLRELLRHFGVLNDQTDTLIEDFNYFQKTGNQRRPAVWAERDSWRR